MADALFNRLLDRFVANRTFVCRAIRSGTMLKGRFAFILDGRGSVGLLEVATVDDAIHGEHRRLGWLDGIDPTASAKTIVAKRRELVTISTWHEALDLIEGAPLAKPGPVIGALRCEIARDPSRGAG